MKNNNGSGKSTIKDAHKLLEWQKEEIQKGLKDANEGKFVSQSKINKLLGRKKNQSSK